MHLYIFVYTVTKCNMHNLSAFVQELYIRERTYVNPKSFSFTVLLRIVPPIS